MSAAIETLQTGSNIATAPAWRRDAFERFAQKGFPDTRNEDWKYTNLRKLARQPFVPATGPTETDPSVFELPDLDAARLVFINGFFDTGSSDLSKLPDGVRVDRLIDRFRDGYVLETDAESRPFELLNTAFVSDGVEVTVEADTQADTPIYLLFVAVGDDEQTVLITPRTIVRSGANSRITLIEHHVGTGGGKTLTNAVTDVQLSTGAVLEHYKLQHEQADAFHIHGIRVDQARDSRYESHNINLGGGLVRNDLNVQLREHGAGTLLNGLFLVRGSQHVDNHTRIDHLSAHTSSEETYRGVLDDKSRGVFSGKVVVHPNAQKIDAQQSSDNLLLSAGAEIDTKPELEIYADDVKCSHGATVGRVDEDALFYLRSRGLDAEAAGLLLTWAFADEVLARLRLEPVRRYLERTVFGRLPGHGELEVPQ